MIGSIDNSATGYGVANFCAGQDPLLKSKESSMRFSNFVREQVEQSDPVTDDENDLHKLEQTLLAMADSLRPSPQKACADTIDSMKQQGFGALINDKFREMLLTTAYDIWPAGQKITTIT